MTKERKIRGNRRPAVKVERDKLVAAEMKFQGKSDTEIAKELDLAPSTARRLASQGLREAINSGDKLSVENLFNLVVSSFVEVLEDIDTTINAYKSGETDPDSRLDDEDQRGTRHRKNLWLRLEDVRRQRENITTSRHQHHP
jgi:hypothetical protein